MMIEQIGTVAAFVMPFFNIPMIIRLVKRKRADDISLIWVGGVWACIILMTPKAFMSSDIAFRLFGYSNIVLFSVLAILVFYYQWKPGKGRL